jgi:hypothetical protein
MKFKEVILNALYTSVLSASCTLVIRKMLDLQHQHNKCTTTPHMRVSPTHWGSPSSSCEGLCICCDSVVQKSNP